MITELLKSLPTTDYRLDNNGISIFTDCMGENGLSLIKDNSVDLILCDLPFGETSNPLDLCIPLNDYIEIKIPRKKKPVKMTFDDYCLWAYKNNGVPFDLLKIIWDTNHKKGLWTEYSRIIKPKTGNVILFGQGHFIGALIKSNESNYRYDVVWNKILKSNHLNAKNMPMRVHESFLVFNDGIVSSTYNPQFEIGRPLNSKGTAYLTKELTNQNYGKFLPTPDDRKGSTEKYPSTIWTYQKPTAATARHRTEKSKALLENIIKTYSNPGETIVDNAAGSGSCGEACLSTSRNYILMENDALEYNKLINNIAEHNIKNGKGNKDITL